MRTIAVLVCFVVVACTRPNPDACCATEADCAALGVDGLRPCDVGQACDPTSTCVAKQCDTSAECGPDAPVCSLGLCVIGCRVDDDCADVAGKPFCAADNVCVGCETSSQCPADEAQCDAEDRACRGCELDSECASGVCLEADGVCAPDASIIFVSSIGADVGQCLASSPCASVGFALQKRTPTRSVIHISGATTQDTATITITTPVTIDGTGTLFSAPSSGPVFAIQASNGNVFVVTFEGIRISTAPSAITAGLGATMRLFNVTLDAANILATNGGIDVQSSLLRNTTAECMSGTLALANNDVDRGALRFLNCQTEISRNRFVIGLNGTIFGSGGVLHILNNTFAANSEFVDLIMAGAQAPGSTIAFNTIVNASTVTQSPNALVCDATVKVTSNIFAYNSTNPIAGTGCVAQFSLFDVQGTPDAGGSNLSADAATFFKDRSGGDFHLSVGSPANNAGEQGVVTIDLEGNMRSATPDLGAFEAP
ncbi:MAG: hypothetical protein H6Q90_4109 [Deltaproteobacteria bacterium]|nr:hypothetical protein [Deltaproteobacteria bacterium]